jgi:hypothetical protein
VIEVEVEVEVVVEVVRGEDAMYCRLSCIIS